MKNLIPSILILFLSINAYATTIEGLDIPLQFDENYEKNSNLVDSAYLVLVTEKYAFPSKTALGKRQKKKFETALNIMEEVINSEKFKNLVISYKRKIGTDSNGNSIYERSYSKNYLWKDPSKRLSNEEIYKIIMRGEEKMYPNTKGEINFNSWVKICSKYERFINLKTIKWCKDVIGSTSPYNSQRIRLNWKFYSKYETPEMLSNMIHEWIHLLGFLHGKSNIHQEVPYVVGGIIKKLAKKLLEDRNSLIN